MHFCCLMLLTIGRRDHPDDLVDLLATCHRRIRFHVVLARRLAERGREASVDEVRNTAAQVRNYFALALPLHVADEDEMIAPQLERTNAAVSEALRTLTSDHLRHERVLERLNELCAAIERDPGALPALDHELARLVDLLAADLAAHLELEERVVFPALRQLPATRQAEIAAAIRRRRERASSTSAP
jgi:iron-sulfur cluster repair protein YtfE (RIC family)